jgi:hypothetical protein
MRLIHKHKHTHTHTHTGVTCKATGDTPSAKPLSKGGEGERAGGEGKRAGGKGERAGGEGKRERGKSAGAEAAFLEKSLLYGSLRSKKSAFYESLLCGFT